MLFSRLASFVVLLSVAGSALAAPLPTPCPGEVCPSDHEGPEIEVGPDDGGYEVEIDRVGPIKEVEVEVVPAPETKHQPTKRDDSDRYLAGSLLAAQNQLDAIKPEIEQAMLGPLGSIQGSVGRSMLKIHRVVATLDERMSSFVGADASVIYRNPSGGAQLTDKELAKIICTFLTRISEIEELTKHVSGYTFTSTQQKIREDLLSMKKTLGEASPELLSATATCMAMALSMGIGAAGIIA